MLGIVNFLLKAFVAVGLTGFLVAILLIVGVSIWRLREKKPRQIMQRFKRAHSYRVVETRGTYSAIIEDGNAQLYVHMTRGEQTNLSNLIELNPDKTVKIIAVVNPQTFEVTRVKGYMVN